MQTTYATNIDPRARLHTLTDGEATCGTAVARRATDAEAATRPVCFLCRTATTEVPDGSDLVTIRVASVVSEYLMAALESGRLTKTEVDTAALETALKTAEVRTVGRGATHFVTLARGTAVQVLAHLDERLNANRPKVGIPRWRLGRAGRMIADDLGLS